ncbi:MAG: GNAT family N-acetyltransferase [Rikenellaceae bacterium]|nr:GNAT family N-acetyltransferase [Rikenellaceae bacterium]
MKRYVTDSFRPSDTEDICGIYNYFVENSAATFELCPLDVHAMRERLDAVAAEGHPCFVCRTEGRTAGFLWLHRWNWREACDATAEVTVYVAPGMEGQGVGSALMERLMEHARKAGLHVLVSCITLPNEASMALHRKFGFVQVSHFSQVGRKFGAWHDVCHMQLVLEQTVEE